MKTVSLILSETYVDKKHTHIAQRVRYIGGSKGFRIVLVSEKIHGRITVAEFSNPLRTLLWSVATFGFSGVKWRG